MNILPHKSWHVRTKKNIARVKKDQAQAAEEEKEKERRIALAAQEARTSFLRERAGQRFSSTSNAAEAAAIAIQPKPEDSDDPLSSTPFKLSEIASITNPDGHVNFFQDMEDGKQMESGVNKDHEEEKKEEQEAYEKKIGLLVYLGQNSLEHSKDRPWYADIDRSAHKTGSTSDSKPKPDASTTTPTTNEKDIKIAKLKDFQDPLKDIRMHLSGPGMKKSSSLPIQDSSYLKRKFATATTSETPEIKRSKIDKKKKKKSSKNKKHKHGHKSKSKKKKHDKNQSNSDSDSDSSDGETEKRKKLEVLRAERLEREKEEKRKAERLMATVRGETPVEPEPPKSLQPNIFGEGSTRKQKYNSQFNPQLARQNYDD